MKRDLLIQLDRDERDALVILCEREIAGPRKYSLMTAVLVSRLKAATPEPDDASR